MQVSRQHWVANKNLSEEIKNRINEIYFSKENREKKTPEEIYQEIIHIKVGKCEICGHDVYLGIPCPGIYNRKLPENPTIYQLKHYKYNCNNVAKAAQNRDNSYLVERNKTQKMRESSRKIGLITGPINMKNNHKKYDIKKSCEECADLNCKNRNNLKLNQFIIGIGCLTKFNNSESMKEAITKRNVENWKNPEYAKKIASNLGEFCIPNFITKNNVRYYKDKELNQLCKDLLFKKEDISNYSGFNIRFGEVYYNSENVLTGKINKFNNSSFYEKDKELYYYDREIKDYVFWNDYKAKFLIFSKDIVLPVEFVIIPTFRTQDSENWEGAKQAFEQSLIDLNISWFVYIKFYINESNKSIPLVCGKSGSLLVNNSGNDLSFSTDINDGPARRFLIENNYQWDKARIAILKCDSEKEAYEKENYYAYKLNLFNS